MLSVIISHFRTLLPITFIMSAACGLSNMLVTFRRLGVTSSFSRPRVSNDNAYAESLSRNCKYRMEYPLNDCSSIDEARNGYCHSVAGTTLSTNTVS